MRKLTLWLPLALFAFFAGLAAYMLTQEKDQFVESTMIGQPLPEFGLQPAFDGLPGAAKADFTGKPKLLNIWASWCPPCIAEAPHLETLQKQGVEIIGIAIRDKPADVAGFLGKYGNPYTRIGSDKISEVQLALGSSGVPETFVIDAKGVIRYQHLGDVGADDVPTLLAELEKAQ